MFNESAIKGLRLIAEGFTKLAEALEESPVNAVTTSEVSEKPVKKTEEKVVEAVAETASDDLSEMSYNNLKKLAKELGISAKGGRNELISAIEKARAEESEDEAEDEEETAEVEEAVEEESEAEDDAEEEDEEDDSDDADEEEEDEEEEQSTADAVAEATEDMSDDELKELLESVGLSSKGKRTALLSRIVKAVDDGLISLDDDEEEEEAEDEDEDDSEEAEDDADVTKGMSKKRREAYEELCDSTTNDFNSGEIERQDLIDFISEFNGLTTKQAKTQYKNVKDEELLDEYLRLMVYFIDDDGEVAEEGAYTIDNVPYCCGHELEYNKKTKKYTCSVCGEEYEAED